MADMQHEVQTASFVQETKDHKTIRQAIQNGVNVGVFGFVAIENGNIVSYCWRLRGDIVEINGMGNDNQNSWEIMNEIHYNKKFDKGVFGKQVDWSLSKQFVRFISLS